MLMLHSSVDWALSAVSNTGSEDQPSHEIQPACYYHLLFTPMLLALFCDLKLVCFVPFYPLFLVSVRPRLWAHSRYRQTALGGALRWESSAHRLSR